MAVNAKALFESARYAPLWSGTSGIYANLSNYPNVEYYVKCPKCGNVHGDYASMKEAHLARLCKVCELEKTNKLKDWIHDVVYPEEPEPGKKPKKLKTVQQVIGVKENLDLDPSELASNVVPNWVRRAITELSHKTGLPIVLADENPDAEDEAEDINSVNVVDETKTLSATIYDDVKSAKAAAYDNIWKELQNNPENFSSDLIKRFIDQSRLLALINMDRPEVEDPWEFLEEVYGDSAVEHAVNMVPLDVKAAADYAFMHLNDEEGWKGFLGQRGKDIFTLPGGCVVVPTGWRR